MTYQAHRLTQRLRDLKDRVAEWEKAHSRLLVEEPYCTPDYEPKMFVLRYSKSMMRVHLDTCTDALQQLLTEIHQVEYALEKAMPAPTPCLSDEAWKVLMEHRVKAA